MNNYSDSRIRDLIGRMSLDEKVGQLFLLAYPGKDPEVLRPLIEKYGISGCYISQDNAETMEEAALASTKLQEMAAQTHQGIPLLLGVDQEGAWGVLVPESHTGPGNLALGGCRDVDRVRRMYGAYGAEMLAVGYNALLGPCADVNIDPSSPIIGTRSFGEFPEGVAECVGAAVEGAAETSILTTLKHFPGHGGTSGDTHREIPMVDKSLEELMKTDLLPFKVGIEAGADIVMTSHIRYPRIDKDNPATLSASILQGLLRERLGFEGVILSDSMNMGAIRRFYDPAESTVLALKAGIDLVMLSEEHYDHSSEYLPKQIESLERVKKSISQGQLAETLVDEKIFRILKMKLNRMIVRGPGLTSEDELRIGAEEKASAREGFVLLQKNLWPLPQDGDVICINASPRSSYKNIMNSRGIGPNQQIPAYDVFQETMKTLEPKATFLSHEDALKENTSLFRSASAVVLVTEDYPLPGEDFEKARQEDLVKKLSDRYEDKTIILGLRSSYELSKYSQNVTYLCANSSRPCSAAEAAHILHERCVEISGKSPVTPRV